MRAAGYAVCFLIVQIKLSNSRSSWRLSADKVVQMTEFAAPDEDPVLSILTSAADRPNGQWSKSAPQETEKHHVYCSDCGYIDRYFAAILLVFF